ncbi:MAG TPA: ATP-binding protein [Candidatus Limnocylindrales bacterium]|nr:ATP-binding protein [Candidatus Limnocylindrales bacterium]
MADEELPPDLLDRAPCGLLLTCPRGNVVAANSTLLSWLGYDRAEIVGKRRFSELMTVAGRIFYETHFAPLLRMQGFVHEIALDLVRKDASSLSVFVSANERRTSDGRSEAIRIAVFQAVDRRKYERELLLGRRMAEQAMRAKSEFLAVFAHEVRNSVAAVGMAAELLQHSGLQPDADRYLGMLRRGLDKALALLQSMLDFSKVEAGKVTLERRRFDLRDLLLGTAQTLEPVALRKQLTLNVEIDPNAPTHLVGDPIKLGQVLTNLAGNAVKFTERGGVTLAVELISRAPHGVVLKFRVTDTGIGISPDRITRIFDEYSQAGPEIAERYGGTGLGLAISRRIIELHGSTICVESAAEQGSTFHFDVTLPVAEPATGDDDSP